MTSAVVFIEAGLVLQSLPNWGGGALELMGRLRALDARPGVTVTWGVLRNVPLDQPARARNANEPIIDFATERAVTQALTEYDRVVWVDDQLERWRARHREHGTPDVADLFDNPRLLTVSPDLDTGLELEHFDQIERHLS